MAAEDMMRISVYLPPMSANCASVIVGLNSEEQVNEICDHADVVLTDSEAVTAVRALSLKHSNKNIRLRNGSNQLAIPETFNA